MSDDISFCKHRWRVTHEHAEAMGFDPNDREFFVKGTVKWCDVHRGFYMFPFEYYFTVPFPVSVVNNESDPDSPFLFRF